MICGKPHSEWGKSRIEIESPSGEFYICYGFPVIGSKVRIHFRIDNVMHYFEGILGEVKQVSLLGTRVNVLGELFNHDGTKVPMNDEIETSIGYIIII